MAGVTGTRQELAGPSQHSPSSSLTDKDKGPEAQRGHRSRAQARPAGSRRAPPTPSPGFPLREQEMGVGEPGCSSHPVLGGAGRPTPVGVSGTVTQWWVPVQGFPWLTHPGLAVAQPRQELSVKVSGWQ